MVEHETVRRLALGFPQTRDDGGEGGLAFSVDGKGFAWTYSRRVTSRGPRQPQPDVLAIRCQIDRKEMLIDTAPDRFFDDDHYRGYAAVLVRLATVREEELAALFQHAWAMCARNTRAKRREGAVTPAR